MVRVKICGITNIEDALLAVDLGTNALGFIFYKESKRFIEPDSALRIISKLPPFVSTVGIFVNQDLDEIIHIRDKVGFDIFQLHGDESPSFCKKLGENVIKTIRIENSLNPKEIALYPVHAFLFDSYSTKDYGGTGESFSWQLLKDFDRSKTIILSGGLTPENVAQAIQIVNPYAVDVSSGVEDSPGKKNPDKLRRFIKAVKNENEI